MIKVMILTKEPETCSYLCDFLQTIPDITVEQMYTSESELVWALQQTPADLLFVNSTFITEQNLYPLIATNKITPLIVLISRSGADALKGYEYQNVIDYLTPDASDQRILLCLTKIRYILGMIRAVKSTDTELPKPQTEHLFIKVNKKMVRLPLKEIFYIESVKDYIKIVTTQKSYLVYTTLTNFTSSLPEDKFVRIHRSYTVALDKIEAIKGNIVEIMNINIPFTRKYQSESKTKLLK